VARWYRKNDAADAAPGGFTGLMEMLIMMVNDELIKPSVGEKEYRKYAPYLLTAFFFIFLANLLGLVPFFPGGANVTGNIAVTMVLALFTFFAINLFGNKHYWKEILWPDVPLFLKFPIPIMQTIELFGVISKPFSLMVRLFANIMAGHMMVLGLVSVIFVTVKLGPVINGSMTVIAMLFGLVINCLELLVAFIQAYVFTMLSAVFIGMAHQGEHS
jgi:F-type H+-transporting ATPase subunit a